MGMNVSRRGQKMCSAAPNVFRMKLLGATVVPVNRARALKKDALNEAMRDWVTNVDSTFYILDGGWLNILT